MKKFLLGSALILLSAGMASAADMPVKAPPAPVAPFSWSGFYIGGHAGYGWGHYDASDNLTVSPTQFFHLQPRGWFGGAQVGYNSQFARNWLLGMEIDVSGGDISRSGIEQPAGGPAQAKVDYFGTARTRFGYVMDRLLIYATGGLAWTHDKYSWAVPDQPAPLRLANDRQFHVGWTIGGGIEYALDARWSLKLEYLYADFRKSALERTIPPALSRTADLNLNTVKIGVNYRLGDPGTASSAMPIKAAALRSIWTGGYIGVHGGYGWGSLHVTDGISGFPLETANLDPKGWFGGFQGGYNWQFAPSWLVGLEADSSFGNLRDSGVTQPSLLATSTKIDELGSARLRLGYVMDRMLVYATGGVAYGHENKTVIAFPGVATKAYQVGPTAGGGVEYKLDQNWSVKAEYLWADLGKLNATRPTFPTQIRTTDLTVNTVKVGLNYSGPVIERLFGAR